MPEHATPSTNAQTLPGGLVVFDLDGTLSDHSHRLHLVECREKQWDRFWEESPYDRPVVPVALLSNGLRDGGLRVEIWTGRSGIVRDETLRWLEKHRVSYDRLLMRVPGDRRPGLDVKSDWLKALDKFPILAVDDQLQAALWWESKGVPCLRVDPHYYRRERDTE